MFLGLGLGFSAGVFLVAVIVVYLNYREGIKQQRARELEQRIRQGEKEYQDKEKRRLDPSGMRAAFYDKERPPLQEIGRGAAELLIREGTPVFAHPFDPLEIDYFEKNGFQVMEKPHGYRFEPVRYYTAFSAGAGASEGLLASGAGLKSHMFKLGPNGDSCAECGFTIGSIIHRDIK